MDEITITCHRLEDGRYCTSMTEDPIDCYGNTVAESLGNFLIEIKKCYEGQQMPYIKELNILKENND